MSDVLTSDRLMSDGLTSDGLMSGGLMSGQPSCISESAASGQRHLLVPVPCFQLVNLPAAVSVISVLEEYERQVRAADPHDPGQHKRTAAR